MSALRAAYSVQELADLTGLTRHQVRRLLDASGVETLTIGRKLLVPLTSFQASFPQLWDSCVARAALLSQR